MSRRRRLAVPGAFALVAAVMVTGCSTTDQPPALPVPTPPTTIDVFEGVELEDDLLDVVEDLEAELDDLELLAELLEDDD